MAVKTMNTLIKLHKRRVDIMRREMVAIEEERKQLVQLSARLQAEHEREMKLSTEEPKVAGFFGAYSKRVRERQEGIKQEIKRLDAAITEKAEAIRAEFSEQKKYEIARENAKKRAAEEARANVQRRFDEIGTQQFVKARDHTA